MFSEHLGIMFQQSFSKHFKKVITKHFCNDFKEH